MLPRIIFKYKPIMFNEMDFQKIQEVYEGNKCDFDNSNYKYISEILEEHKLYCPTRNELNDPFEALQFRLYGNAVAGGSLYSSNRELPPHYEELLSKYRILSLTDNAKSPVMWGLYANNYNGVCIGFKTDGTFNNIKHVTYVKENEEVPECWFSDSNLLKIIRDSFYKKFKCWENESEYRIIQEEKYLCFDKNEIELLVIGHNVSEKYKNKLTDICEKQGIPVYYTYLDKVRRKVLFKEIQFQKIYDGEEIETDF